MNISGLSSSSYHCQNSFLDGYTTHGNQSPWRKGSVSKGEMGEAYGSLGPRVAGHMVPMVQMGTRYAPTS